MKKHPFKIHVNADDMKSYEKNFKSRIITESLQ